MRRAYRALLPLLAVSGCAAPPPVEPVAPAPSAITGDTPGDAPVFPVPAVAATPPYAMPQPREIRLANGARALLVERSHAPLAAVSVVIRWPSPAPDAAREQMLREVLLDSPDASGRRLSERLGAGVEARAIVGATTITFSIVSYDLERSLGAFVEAFRRGELPADRLDHHRRRALEVRSREKPRDRIWAETAAWLFPAGDPEGARVTDFEASLNRLTVRDLDAYRRAAFRPDAVAFCVAGDVGTDALREALERVTGDWTAPAPRRPAPRAASKIPGGALLIQAPEENGARVLILAPAPGFMSADVAADVAEEALHGLVARRMDGRLTQLTGGNREAKAGIEWRSEHGFFFAGTDVRGPNIPVAARAFVDALGDVAHGELSDQEIGWARENVAARQERSVDGAQKTAEALARLEAAGRPLDWAAKRYEATRVLRRDDVRRAAEAHLRAGGVRVVAIGDVTGAKDELERMKLGPVTVRTAGAPPALGVKK